MSAQGSLGGTTGAAADAEVPFLADGSTTSLAGHGSLVGAAVRTEAKAFDVGKRESTGEAVGRLATDRG